MLTFKQYIAEKVFTDDESQNVDVNPTLTVSYVSVLNPHVHVKELLHKEFKTGDLAQSVVQIMRKLKTQLSIASIHHVEHKGENNLVIFLNSEKLKKPYVVRLDFSDFPADFLDELKNLSL